MPVHFFIEGSLERVLMKFGSSVVSVGEIPA